MVVDIKIYDQRFFENTIKFEGPSAKAAVGILIKHFNPASVIDIGCGAGIYLYEFASQGVEIEGYDGSPAAVAASLVGDRVKVYDLTKPLRLDRRFGLALCIEVAEHLAEVYADTLVDSLCLLSDTIIFTAATPGQGPESIGHINEQPHQYWIDKFSLRGFAFKAALSDLIRQEMVEAEVVWWVSKNLMIFQK